MRAFALLSSFLVTFATFSSALTVRGSTDTERRAPPKLWAPPSRTQNQAELSNAQRLALGLPVKRPKQLYDPTRVKRQVASGTPDCFRTGYVDGVSLLDGKRFGFLLANFTTELRLGLNNRTIRNALEINVRIPGCITTRSDGPIVRRVNFGLFGIYVGFFMDYPSVVSATLGLGRASLGRMGYTANPTLPYSVPRLLNNSLDHQLRKGLTAVWNIDFGNNRISPVWTNPDGTTIAIQPFYRRGSRKLYFTGDVNAVRAQLQWNDTVPLRFEFVSKFSAPPNITV